MTEASAPPAPFSPDPSATSASAASANDALVENNVFDSMVQSDDDFLGLLSYSLYKRHKIEWLRADRKNSALEFKKVACTPAQMSMYRSKAENLSMGFIDLSMAELGEKMRTDIQKEELMVAISKCNPSLEAWPSYSGWLSLCRGSPNTSWFLQPVRQWAECWRA